MRTVLISMKPYWWFLICEGYKKLEVRKTFPQSEDWDKTAFVYVTKDKASLKDIPEEFRAKYEVALGTVAGKFVCNGVDWVDIPYPAFQKELDKKYIELSCVRYYALHRYAYHDSLAFWDVSDVHSFDTPKDISDFTIKRKSPKGCGCIYSEYEATLERPPQSWCYVEGAKE